jgi:hypothetical protein
VDERSERIQRRFEWPVLAAALLVIPVIVVEETSPGGALGDDRAGDELADLGALRRRGRDDACGRPEWQMN